MPSRDEHAGSLRCAFFRNLPRRSTVALSLIDGQRRDQHADERRGPGIGVLLARVSTPLIDIGRDGASVRAALRLHHCWNIVSGLSMPPLPAHPRQPAREKARHNEPGVAINGYGVRRARDSYQLLHGSCHDDHPRASLLLWSDRTGKQHGTRLSEHHTSPRAGQMRIPFLIHCAEKALRRLNGKEASK